MSENKLTGGQAVVRSLINAGVDTVFGLPGVQNDWLYNAFYDYQDEIRVIHTRHEQGAAYMALGYNLASGKHGIFNVVPGPGFLNSSAALATAWGLNAKIMCLVGQIPLNALGKGYGVLHEIADQRGILASLTKESDYVTSPEEIPGKVNHLLSALDSGRPRPVGLEVAMNILSAEANIDFSSKPEAEAEDYLDESSIEVAANLISQAKQPLIFVASGAMDAHQEVRDLANFLQAPVFSYRTGKGIMPDSSYLSFPTPAAHMLWEDADVVIGIGTHTRMPLMKWGKEGIQYISINIDPEAHDKMIEPAVKITGYAKPVSAQLLDILKSKMDAHESKEAEMLALKTKWDEQTAYLEPQKTYLDIIRDELPDDGIFVDELTQVGFASRILWETNTPRTYLCTGHMGTLGWGFQTALGAKVAKPDKMVVSVTGDGGFMFGVQELATAVLHKIGLIVLLFNNNLFGNVRSMQEDLYDNRVIASDLKNPDFVAMAKSFGAHACRVDSFDTFRSAIREANGRDLPTVIEIPVSNDWPSTNKFKALPKIR